MMMIVAMEIMIISLMTFMNRGKPLFLLKSYFDNDIITIVYTVGVVYEEID